MSQNPRTVKSRRDRQRGAALLEGAVVMTATFLLILGSFDLGLLIVRYNALAEAARHGARAAIVRGQSSTELGAMGPGTMTFTADAENDIALACRTVLPTIAAGDVEVEVVWPDDSNDVGDPVAVTVRYQHQFTFPLLWELGPVELDSTSTMAIAH